MSVTPRVSVLVTAYNREHYLAEAIDSVLAQTLEDFELIVSDDGSADGSVRIAEEYVRRDPRVRLSVNPVNLGDYGNRRQAATLARGRFLKYHDSDDVMYPHCLAVMADALSKEPSAAFAMSASHSWPGGPSPMLLTPRLAYEREFLGSGLFQLGPASAMFRADQFRALGGFPVAGVASDYLFWVEACARVNVLLVPGDLFHYRVHDGQELANPANDLQYAHAAAAAWRMLNSRECPLSGDALERAKRNFAYVQARGAYRHCKRGRFAAAVAVIRHTGPSVGEWIRYMRPPRRNMAAGTPPARHETQT
jgi:hypothetical protein